jgi:hypothetical protein
MGRVSDGSQTASGNSRYEIHIDWGVNYYDDGFTIDWNRWLDVVRGNFGGTLMNPSWWNQISVYDGVYADQHGTTGVMPYGTNWSMGISCDYQGGGHWAGCTASETVWSPQWAPYAVGDMKASKTANGATLTWSRNERGARPYNGYYIQRQIDGGGWSTIATVTNGGATSYEDKTLTAGHVYKYRVAPYNDGGQGDWATASQSVYSTPATPTITGTGRVSNTTVYLDMDNPCKIATKLVVQSSTDGKTWADLASFTGLVTHCEVNPGSGSFYFRVRNERGSDVGAWSAVSEKVVTITPPAAPSLVSPTTEVIASDAQPVVLKWHHNPIDGSAQTAAEVTYTIGGTSTTETVEGETSEIQLPTVAVNTSVTWTVRTKGIHADYGAVSAKGAFKVVERPSISVNVTETIGQLPVPVSITYDDNSGTFNGATLRVSRDGTEVYTEEMAALTCEVDSNELLFEDGATYRFAVTVRSTSSLQASAWAESEVHYTLPHPPILSVDYSEETGSASLVCRWENDADDGLAEAVSCDVYRIDADGSPTPLVSGMANGGSYVDKLAPLNTDYAYLVQTVAESGARNGVTFNQRFTSPYWFILWGEKVARAKWNPSQKTDKKRPNKTRIYYAGRDYPVSYDDDAKEESKKVSGRIVGIEEVAKFDAFMDDGGRGIYKSLVGEVIYVDGDVSYTNLFDRSGVEVDVELSITRIDGGM